MVERRPPDHFGPYVVLGQIGSGGMGSVYRARDSRLGREVAVKVLHRHLEISGARERFLREARTISSLNHPNICTIFDIGEQDGDPFLVMELLTGESLRDRMARGRIPAGDLHEIAFRIALALQAAHGKGIIHRDIKPANLFLVDDQRGATDMKVLDFGLAKLESDRVLQREDLGLTRSGATVGTVEYMSPEQACGEDLDARSDLFSLGAVLYEMATGVVPFRGATSAVVFSELLNRAPVPPREMNLDVPEDLDRIIRGLLVKKREFRIGSASMLLDALAGQGRPSEIQPLLRNKVHPLPSNGEQERSSPGAIQSAGAPAATAATAARPATIQQNDAPPDQSRNGSQGASASPVRNTSPGTSERSKNETDAAQVPAVMTPLRPSRTEPPHERMHSEQAGPAPAFGSRFRRGSAPISAAVGRAGSRAVPSAKTRLAEAGVDPVAGLNGARRTALPRFAVVALLLGVALAAFFVLHHRTPARMPRFRGALQVLPLVNQAGERALDRACTVAMQILLAESPNLAVRQVAPLDYIEGGTEGSMAQVRSGTPPAVLSGTLSRTGKGYVLQMRVLDAATRSELTSTEENAASVEMLPDALSHAVRHLRNQLGEDGDLASSTDLREEASPQPAALVFFGEGEAKAETGDLPSAIAAYQHALTRDTHFQLARVRLATLLLGMHADRDAYAVAQPLWAEAPKGGAHLQAERAYLLARLGDPQNGALLRAASVWRSSRSQDVDAQQAAARELLAAGHFREAQEAALAAATLNPYSRDGQALLTETQIACGHPDAAWSTQTRAYDYGFGSAGLSLAAAFLREDATGVQAAFANLKSSDDAMSRREQAVYFANTGQSDASSTAYDQAVASVKRNPAISSAADFLRAEQILNRALMGRCLAVRNEAPGELSQANQPTNEAFLLGSVAEAWCSRIKPTQQTSPMGDDKGLIVGANRWKKGDLQGALAALNTQAITDHTMLMQLMRGRLHVLLGDMPAAIADYNLVLSAPGPAYLSGLAVYPAALAGSADAYTSMGDLTHARSTLDALEGLARKSGPTGPMPSADHAP